MKIIDGECQECGAVDSCVEAYNQGGYDSTVVCFACIDRLRGVEPTGVLARLRSIGDHRCTADRVLLVCAQAADHLEHAMGWDGHGWETVREAVRVAAAYLDDRMPTDQELGCGPPSTSVERLRHRPFGARPESSDG